MGLVVDNDNDHFWWMTPADLTIICATSSLLAFFVGLVLGGLLGSPIDCLDRRFPSGVVPACLVCLP